jgi:hypothetical protein
MTVRRKSGDASAQAKSDARQKRRARPPWGGILGGKPIERHYWRFKKKVARNDKLLRTMQYTRMLYLKRHYGILGGDYDYPIKGVGSADWLPWYELALAIASDLDDSLKIIDAAPLGKTTPRWRGFDGLILLDLVEGHQTAFPRRPVRWSLHQLQKQIPELRQLPLDHLVVRYHEAKRYHRGTKRSRT